MNEMHALSLSVEGERGDCATGWSSSRTGCRAAA
jgi:hypothetical protein